MSLRPLYREIVRADQNLTPLSLGSDVFHSNSFLLANNKNLKHGSKNPYIGSRTINEQVDKTLSSNWTDKLYAETEGLMIAIQKWSYTHTKQLINHFQIS